MTAVYTYSFEEVPGSRRESFDPPRYSQTYKASGETDDDVVHNSAQSNTPVSVSRPTTGTLFRRNIQIEEEGFAQFLVTVEYGRLDSSSVASGSYTFNFSTQGATVNTKASKQHIATYPDNEDFHNGAIGVKDDGEVEGADIVIPALQLTYAFNHPEGVVTEAFARNIASVTGTVNSVQFQGFKAGELLFLGATGADGTSAEATVSYEFVASQNSPDAGLAIGNIGNIIKKGHELAWIEFADEVAEGEAVRRPKRVYIERVYDAVNFAAALGWGGP